MTHFQDLHTPRLLLPVVLWATPKQALFLLWEPGIIFGSILGVGAYQLSQDPSNYTLMLGTTTTLGGLMGYRYYNGRKFMPAGLMFCMSVGMLTKLLVKNVGSNRLPVKTG
ncbi:unnamed protein product [Leptosia nina]|uniref:Transmembrane protein 14C n=1 Tax=Leptosia nina TaxID=320188 RepID=A0AAV1J5D0_9NEOP